ncbi:MAG: sigma-70 family RNA polymerase sigma factor [Ignavibacteriales bacterium]|nr:MAG: sigma-70 family RNA polymerase sigma factor [Ignavibacteriales bacterium]
MSGSAEVNIIKEIVHKQERALGELYDLYGSLCYRIIYRITRDRMLSEELLQNVFIKIWENAESFSEQKGSVYSWITAMTRNLAIDKIRSKEFKEAQQFSETPDDFSEHENSVTRNGLQSMLIDETAERIIKALKQIPPEQKLVIEMSFFEGMTHTEISDTLELPLGTIKTRMRQGLIKLHRLLEQYNEGHE